jgi:hypothetical protein
MELILDVQLVSFYDNLILVPANFNLVLRKEYLFTQVKSANSKRHKAQVYSAATKTFRSIKV